MIPKLYKKPGTQNPDATAINDAVEDYVRQVASNPLLVGALFTGVRINTTVSIPHGLGQPWVGYLVINKSAATPVYTQNTTNRNILLNLASGADVTVDLWVF